MTERRCKAWVLVMVVADLPISAEPETAAAVLRYAVALLALVALVRPRPKHQNSKVYRLGNDSQPVFFWGKKGGSTWDGERK